MIYHVELFFDFEGEDGPALMACGKRLHFVDDDSHPTGIRELGHDFYIQRDRRKATCPECISATTPERLRERESAQ